jgi:GNAT superfamily N-acetyltransferase
MPPSSIEQVATAGTVIRRPSAGEWPACRMLLPEAFSGGAAPQALLAFNAVGTLLGGAAFHQRDGAVHGLRLHVVRSHRLRGAGKQLVGAVLKTAAEWQAREVNAAADTLAEPDAEPFLLACGFVRKSRVFTIVAEMQPLCEYVFALRERLLSRGGAPAGARIAGIRESPAGALARLYTEEVVPAFHLHPGQALPLLSDPRFADSPVLLVDGKVAGMMLGEANDGSGTSLVAARVVARPHRGGRGWANLLLLAAALERGRAKSACRMRFEMPEENRDTRKLVERVRGEVVGIGAWFVRHV